jgi:hypothetical protein
MKELGSLSTTFLFPHPPPRHSNQPTQQDVAANIFFLQTPKILPDDGLSAETFSSFVILLPEHQNKKVVQRLHNSFIYTNVKTAQQGC